MSNSLKAVLLSVFFYPGTGHFFLKKHKAGCAFITLFSIPLFLLINEMVNQINLLVTHIEDGSLPLDVVSITEAVSQITSDATALSTNIYIMIAISLISAIDAYRVGQKQKAD